METLGSGASEETIASTQLWARRAAYATYGSAAWLAWLRYVGEFGVAFGWSRGSSIGIHVFFGYGRSGSLGWAHGLGSWMGYTQAISTADMSRHEFLILDGIPILFPAAVSKWVEGKPDVGDCGRAAWDGFKKGWGG